jgi:hypothetical protein
MPSTQDDRERSSPVSRSPQHAKPNAPVGGALTPIRDSMPTPVAPRPPVPGSVLSRLFDVIMGWGVTWEGPGSEGDPRDQRNLVQSYQVAVLAKDATGTWRYAEGSSPVNTDRAERLTLGQLVRAAMRPDRVPLRQRAAYPVRGYPETNV